MNTPFLPDPPRSHVGWLATRAALCGAVGGLRALLDTLPHGTKEHTFVASVMQGAGAVLAAVEDYQGWERSRPHKRG